MNYPMKDKYIDRIVGGNWFIFGEYADGKVDIASADYNELFTHLTKEQANKLIQIRETFLKSLYNEIGFGKETRK